MPLRPGIVEIKSAIQVRTPYLTVAGQTSPGGVQIKGTGQPDGDWGVWFVNGAHDIIAIAPSCKDSRRLAFQNSGTTLRQQG